MRADDLQLVQVPAQLVLDLSRARTCHIEVREARQQVAQALGFAQQHEHRGRRDVDGPGQLAQLGALAVDAIGEERLALHRSLDLDVQVGDLLLDDGDLSLDLPLLRGVVLKRLLQLLLGSERIREVAAELGAYLVDQGLLVLRVAGRAVGGHAGGACTQHEHRDA